MTETDPKGAETPGRSAGDIGAHRRSVGEPLPDDETLSLHNPQLKGEAAEREAAGEPIRTVTPTSRTEGGTPGGTREPSTGEPSSGEPTPARPTGPDDRKAVVGKASDADGPGAAAHDETSRHTAGTRRRTGARRETRRRDRHETRHETRHRAERGEEADAKEHRRRRGPAIAAVAAVAFMVVRRIRRRRGQG
jgi:hypothetical protein